MWAAIINTILGLWLMTAPGVLNFGGKAAIYDYIVAPVEITFAITAIWEVNRSARFINIPAGIWIAAMPIFLHFDSSLAAWNNAITGLLITALSFVKGKIEGSYGGGWKALLKKKPHYMLPLRKIL